MVILHPSRSYKRSLGRFGMTGGLVATLDGSTTSTNKLQTRQTPVNQLHRAHQTAVFRLRTHHAPLNAHLHRVKKEHPAKCVYCPDSDETVEHFLFHCPLYVSVRQHQIQTPVGSTKYTQHAIWIHYTTATNSHLQHVSHEKT